MVHNADELYKNRYSRHVCDERIEKLLQVAAAPEVSLDEENA